MMLAQYDKPEVEAAFQHWALKVAPEQLRGRRNYQPSQEDTINAARALRKVRDRRLYREVADNFYVYCAARWGLRPDEADRMIARADQADNMPVVAPPTPPAAPVLEVTPSFVYFIECGGFVKIGVAVNVEKRLASLQTGNPAPLTLLVAISGNEKMERELHKRFAVDRVQGEWFNFSPALKAYIGGLK